ncbi:helix-turn-helix transcriptional regulator [Mucilaginibacter sp. JRF]|uniref:helix-turn-helix domain-containing protein n=1 Tax=Mucilaginibacter sp. JRF TaxID=2780088 RepID=UPI00187FE59F|nr:helix-turn-helix transcriptional regulator [Mucilaginibacter sp. JRF]MBE9586466.1 helix-turn-helix transcriptional regulator [Mucilaginibacter sp. JRF]
MRFGEKIKYLREENGLFQREIAAELSIDTPMYSKIEGGSRKAKRQQVLQLVKIFNTNEEELMSVWLADQVLDILKNEEYGLSSLLIVGKDLYPNNTVWV